MLLTSKIERRKLLIGVFMLFIASHVLTAVAGTSPRWSSRAPAWRWRTRCSGRSPPRWRSAWPACSKARRAELAGGTALAMVLGLPLGRVVGQLLGWRMTYRHRGVRHHGAAAVAPAAGAEKRALGSLASVPLLFKRPALLALYMLTVIVVTAHFTAYSYIEPFIQTVAGLSENFTLMLLLFGAAGIVGSLLFSRYSERFPSGFFIGAIALLTLSWCCCCRPPAAPPDRAVHFLGYGDHGHRPVDAGQVLSTAPDATDVAMAIFSGLYNFGIGSGALLGNG